MGVQIVQAKLIDQRLLHLLVQDEVAVGVDVAAAIAHRLRHVPVDVDDLAIAAVAREIWNVVLPVDCLRPPHDRIKRTVHHQVRNVPFGNAQLLVRRVRMAMVERHRITPWLNRNNPSGLVAINAATPRKTCGEAPKESPLGRPYQGLKRRCLLSPLRALKSASKNLEKSK